MDSLTFSCHASLSISLFISPLDGTQCPDKADKCKLWLVNQHWCVHVLDFTREGCLWVHPYFTCTVQHFMLTFLRWYVRWEVSGHTAANMWSAAYKQHAVPLCSYHLAFFPKRPDFNMVDNLSIAGHVFSICILTSLSVDEILLLRYIN